MIDGVKYRGQGKKQFLLRCLAKDDEIKLLNKELRAYRWVKFEEFTDEKKKCAR